MSFLFLIFCNILIFYSKPESEEEKLIFVMTHFRHGARAPQHFYFPDEYKDYAKEFWDNPGELTGMGQRMHYLLGIRNRLRYIDGKKFLSNKFNPHEILIYSSPFNRTIISVSSQLQGLYPQYVKQGENITEEQKDFSKPQVNVDCEKINEEIENLNLSALPNNMILAPIRMINNNERKITLYDIEPCTEIRDKYKKKNEESISSLLNITSFFKEKFSQNFDKIFGKKENYDMNLIDNVCDAFISGYTHRRKMSELMETGLNSEQLINFCFDFQKLNFRDWVLGDKKRDLAHLEVSKLMKEFIHYMKERIDADIKGEIIDKKYDDYSRPKMMMISGHDSTVSCFEIFLFDALGYNITEYYIYPKFASQIAFEVTTNDDNKEGKKYSDYFINYYFNDEPIFKINVEEFIEKISPHIWSDQEIDDFCGFENNYGKKDSSKTLLILFISLTSFLVFISLILLICLIRKKKVESNVSQIYYSKGT